MGMFDKDRVFGGDRLDEEFEDGIPFLLLDAEVVAEGIDTGNDLPPASKTMLIVAHLKGGNPGGPVEGEPKVVGTLASAIADKVRLKSDGDLPAVVETQTVPSKDAGRNDAKVLQWVAAWDGDVPKHKLTLEKVAGLEPAEA